VFDRRNQTFTSCNLADENPIPNGGQVPLFAGSLQSTSQFTNQYAVTGLYAEEPELGANNQTGIKILG